MKENCSLMIKATMGVLAFLFTACESLYIPDPIDPRLPKYTERGNDVAGALVNGSLWKSQVDYDWLYAPYNIPTLHYYAGQDSLGIEFLGELEGDEYSRISFGLSQVGNIDRLASMTKLRGKKFDLGSGDNVALISGISDCNTPAVSGQLYLRSIKYNSTDEYLILSGTFGFTILDPVCGEKEITYGRFDFEISRLN